MTLLPPCLRYRIPSYLNRIAEKPTRTVTSRCNVEVQQRARAKRSSRNHEFSRHRLAIPCTSVPTVTASGGGAPRLPIFHARRHLLNSRDRNLAARRIDGRRGIAGRACPEVIIFLQDRNERGPTIGRHNSRETLVGTIIRAKYR